jgi:hypothetical protein
MTKPNSGGTQVSAQICLQCPTCEIIIPVPAEESALLTLGARALIDCPHCHARFTGEPQRLWKFFDRTEDITEPSIPPPEYPPK